MIEEFEEIKSIINTQYSNPEIKSDIDTDFLNVVAERVAELMETNMELFFNHLYRMDIDERRIHQILQNPEESESVYISIAKIIIERQKKRIETKRKYRQEPIKGWDVY